MFSLAIHPFQNLLLSGSEDETIKMWDIRVRSSCVLSLEGHSEPITCVQFHPSGDDIASCSYDGLIRIWDMKNGACRRTIIQSNKPPMSASSHLPHLIFIPVAPTSDTLPMEDISSPAPSIAHFAWFVRCRASNQIPLWRNMETSPLLSPRTPFAVPLECSLRSKLSLATFGSPTAPQFISLELTAHCSLRVL